MLALFNGGCTHKSSSDELLAAPQQETQAVDEHSVSTVDPFEEEEWDIVPFTDPRDSEVYDIIDGRVIIAFKDAPELPEVAHDYFDVELDSEDDYYEVTYFEPTEDEDIATFIAEEELEVYSTWAAVKGIAAVLPEGQTVSDAVENWPSEYSTLIESVDPDQVIAACVYNPPNDQFYSGQWGLASGSNYDINIQAAWASDDSAAFGSSSHVIAVLDSGVDWDPLDMKANSTLIGVNTGDKKGSTTFTNRSLGGGEPWEWLLDKDANHAKQLGHGTCVASIIAAEINNDTIYSNDYDRWIAGVADNPKYLPVAMKAKGTVTELVFSTSAIINAYTAIGVLAGIYNGVSEYGITYVHQYQNIKVVNCSYGGKKASYLEKSHLKKLTKHFIFVCSAGNEGTSSYSVFPASHTGAASVAAYDEDGDRSVWGGQSSNYASDVDIAAPGTDIAAIDMSGQNSNSDNLGYDPGVLVGFAGTSAAAPHVAAVAALLRFEFPSYNPSQIITRIKITKAALPGGAGNLSFCGRYGCQGSARHTLI